MRVRSPTNASLREVMITPNASIPTNNKPIAVSPERRKRRVTRLTPPIITTAPTAAPTMPETPKRRAVAIPGKTPWARASPTKARPRSTTNVPAIAHDKATKIPPINAKRRNSLLRNGSMNTLLPSHCTDQGYVQWAAQPSASAIWLTIRSMNS